MPCLGCGSPQERGVVNLCPACLEPRIGRAQTREEAVLAVLRADEQALDRYAQALFGRGLEGVVGSPIPAARVEAAWLALTPAHRALERTRALEAAQEAAGVPSPPLVPTGLRVIR